MLPRGYGVGWYDVLLDQAICYPVPFHKLIGWARRIYWDFVRPPKGPRIDSLREAQRGSTAALEDQARTIAALEDQNRELHKLVARLTRETHESRRLWDKVLEGDEFPDWGEYGSEEEAS